MQVRPSALLTGLEIGDLWVPWDCMLSSQTAFLSDLRKDIYDRLDDEKLNMLNFIPRPYVFTTQETVKKQQKLIVTQELF